MVVGSIRARGGECTQTDTSSTGCTDLAESVSSLARSAMPHSPCVSTCMAAAAISCDNSAHPVVEAAGRHLSCPSLPCQQS